MSVADRHDISCIILAGGEGRRVGGQDKGLVQYNGRPLIETVIGRIKDQVDDIVISANRNIDTYRKYSSAVVNDNSSEYRGPLSGIAACLPYCQHSRVLIVACDMPALPEDLIFRLSEALEQNDIAIATIDGRHQLALLVNKHVCSALQQRLENRQLKLIEWVESTASRPVSFDDRKAAFINMNRLPGNDY